MINPNFFNCDENNKPDEKSWSVEDILKMWPQAAGELRGFQRALEARSGVTASQLGMALQLANSAFEKIKNDSVTG